MGSPKAHLADIGALGVPISMMPLSAMRRPFFFHRVFRLSQISDGRRHETGRPRDIAASLSCSFRLVAFSKAMILGDRSIERDLRAFDLHDQIARLLGDDARTSAPSMNPRFSR